METGQIIKIIHPYTFCIIQTTNNSNYIFGNDIYMCEYILFRCLGNKKRKRILKRINIYYNSKNPLRISNYERKIVEEFLATNNICYVVISSRLSYDVILKKEYSNNSYIKYMKKSKAFMRRLIKTKCIIQKLSSYNYNVKELNNIMGIVKASLQC